MPLRGALSAVVLAASLVLVPATPASGACGWKTLPTPNKGTDDNFAMDASYTSRRQGWLIGYRRAGSASKLFSMRWDGRSWRSVKTPSPGGDATAMSIAALPDGTAWTVGFNNAALSTFRMFFNGTRWVQVPGPKNEPVGTSLRAVAAVAPSNVWAVGDTGATSVIERWDGRRWKLVDHAEVPGATQQWWSEVTNVPGTKDVWVAGGYADGPLHPLTMRWTAGAWQPPESPDPGQVILQDVAASGPDDAWVVGYVNGSVAQTYTAHWDGVGWATVPSPNPSVTFPGNYLYGVAAPAEGFAHAAGHFTTPGWGSDPMALRWDGGGWQDASPASTDESYELLGAAAIPGTPKVSLIGYERVGGVFETRVITGC